jgi:hypothetical protein
MFAVLLLAAARPAQAQTLTVNSDAEISGAG